jgi:hypothetical protein
MVSKHGNAPHGYRSQFVDILPRKAILSHPFFVLKAVQWVIQTKPDHVGKDTFFMGIGPGIPLLKKERQREINYRNFVT